MRRVKILYASADVDSIDQVTRELDRYGYDVVSCTRGTTAVRIATEHDIDVALLAIDLIGMNGFEICRTLRERFDPGELPIAICASRDSQQWRLTAFESGANSFVFEPILWDRLDRVLRSLLKFKLRLEECIPISEALEILAASYSFPRAEEDEERAPDLWPHHADYTAIERYCELFYRNYLNEPSQERLQAMRSLFSLLLRMSERLGTVAAAIERLDSILQGSRLGGWMTILRKRFLGEPIPDTVDERALTSIDALIVLLEFSDCVVRRNMDADAAFSHMERDHESFDSHMLRSLRSIVGKDDFMERIFNMG